MIVGIIGLGVTGGALKDYFNEMTTHTLRLSDPKLGFDDDMSDCEAIFICVPTPTVDGKQDLRILESVIDSLPADADVFIRSTVLPGTADHYGCWAMPEFLTERTALEDMFNQGIITGCTKAKLLDDLFPDKEVTMVSNTEAELAKYAHNCFGAVKVNYFNMIYEICERLNCRYENVKDACLMSGYINDVHMTVPGPDGKFGYGGKCFPDNISAFFGMFKYGILRETIESNYRYRHNAGHKSLRLERYDSPISS